MLIIIGCHREINKLVTRENWYKKETLDKWKQKEGRIQRNLKDLASFLELFLQSLKKMENKVYKVLSEWKLDNLKEKFKGIEICRL